MTQVHFTLKSEGIQSIIEYSVRDDVSKNILTAVFNQLMRNRRTEYIQAKECERTENRQSQRNGYYEYNSMTRAGTLESRVPRTRNGRFSPTVFERCQRNEKALMTSMLEIYASGVSARKVLKIMEELCGESVSKSFVSSLTEQLEPMVNEWQNRLLSEKDHPYLITDVLYIKIREENRVLSKSCHIAIGITKDGDREIIGFMIQSSESEETWTALFEYLKERGLQGTGLIISDAHRGLVSAIRESFTNVGWQGCQVHFLRNIFAIIPKENSRSFREAVKGIFKFTDINLARKTRNRLIHDYTDQSEYSKAHASLDDGLEGVFQYTIQGNSHNQLKSTNLIERLNQEVRRREKIIRIFPNQTSANRLTRAVLMDLHDERIYSSGKYINFDK